MKRNNHDRFRETLIDLRRRVTEKVAHVEEAIREDSPAGNLSNAPVHIADAAGDGIDADVEVLETERGIIKEIDAALARIEEGTFGACEGCGTKISDERLKAIPYASLCIECARGSED